MTGRRKYLWGIALLVAVPVPAFAQDMCPALGRIEAASRERVPFASLVDAQAKGDVLVPGFIAESCRVTPGRDITCWRNIAPRSLEWGAIEPVLRDCLGVAPLARSGARNSSRRNDLVFVARGLRYRVGNSCDHTCRAGLIASFEVTLASAPND